MKQRVWKRCLSVLVVVSFLVGMTGTAFAWELPAYPGDHTNLDIMLDGGIDTGGGFVVSADGRNWKHYMYISEILHQYDSMGNPNPADPMMEQSGTYPCWLQSVSFDPNEYMQRPGYMPYIPIGATPQAPSIPVTVCEPLENDPNIHAYTMCTSGVQYGVVYLKRDAWQSYAEYDPNYPDYGQSLHLHFGNLMGGLHAMLDLRYLQDAYASNGASVSIPSHFIVGETYMPLHVADGANGGYWQDTDNDGVCSASEIQSGLTLGAPVNCTSSFSFHHEYFQADVNLLPAGTVIPIPILIWNEGQTLPTQPMQPMDNMPYPIAAGFAANRYLSVPFDYGIFTAQNGAIYSGITGINPSSLAYDWQYSSSDPTWIRNPSLLALMQTSGFMMEESTQTLFLPDNIDGMPVQALGSDLFRYHGYDANVFSQIQTIVVPNSVQYLANHIFNTMPSAIQRLHLPVGVQCDDAFFSPGVTTVCTSTYDPVMDAYCQMRGIAYEVCAGHIPLHTHTFDSVVVTQPTYHANGYTTYTCTNCGGSYTTPGSAALSAPTLALQGGSAVPGGTVDVAVALANNGGLDDVTLLPQYDPQTLTLEAVSAAQGSTAAIVSDASGGLPTVTVTPPAAYTGTDLCTLTFRVAADAAAGQQTVQMTASLTPPAAHADPTPLSLAAAQTEVTIQPAPALSPALTVQSVSGTPGALVPVTVRLEDNPGLISLMMEIDYDPAALELDHVEDCGLFGTGSANDSVFETNHDLSAVPYTVCWSDATTHQANTQTGDLAVLWFRVRMQAQPGTYAVSVRSVDHSTLDLALDTVAVGAGAGQVQISVLTGDANGDGAVSAADALAIRQSLHDPAAAPIAPANADIDCDGVVTENDAAALQQFIVDNP